MRKGATLGAAAVLCLTSAVAPAAQSGQSVQAIAVRESIRATGEGTATATPDQAELNIGVVTQATTADQASAENARKVEAVLAAVRRALEPAAEVKTIGYSITPNYVYPREGGEAKITGYIASNTVRVKTSELNRVGPVIDAASQAGANNVQGLQFSVKDDAPVRAAALRDAAVRAREQANAIAAALGVRVGRILLAEEGGPTVRPFVADAMEMRTASAAKTPVEPGTVEVRAVVTLTVEILQ